MLLRMTPKAYWAVLLEALMAPITHLRVVRRCLKENAALVRGNTITCIHITVSVTMEVEPKDP